METTRPLALVTGAAHRLGKAIALGLAKRGYLIGLHYHHSGEAAGQTAAEIRALGGQALLLPADLRQPEAVRGMFSRLDGAGSLRLLVNCAGEMPRMDLMEAGLGDWESAMNLNLRAPWLCAQEAARRMPEGSLMINITDAAVGKAWRGMGLYLLSKAALEELTRLLARRLAPAIRVNAVAPGLILADAHTTPEEWQRLVARLPLQRQGDPQSVLDAVLFLLDSPHITGQTIVVDGGYQLL